MGMSDECAERLETKLDDIIEKVYAIHGLSQTHEEHLKNLNGKVARHEEEFVRVYEIFTRKECEFRDVAKDLRKLVDSNTDRINMARGAVAVCGLLACVTSLVAIIF